MYHIVVHIDERETPWTDEVIVVETSRAFEAVRSQEDSGGLGRPTTRKNTDSTEKPQTCCNVGETVRGDVFVPTRADTHIHVHLRCSYMNARGDDQKTCGLFLVPS